MKLWIDADAARPHEVEAPADPATDVEHRGCGPQRGEPSVDDGLLQREPVFDAATRKALVVGHV